MRRYIVKRLLLIVPTLLIVTFIISALSAIIPGDAVTSMAKNRRGSATSEETLDTIRISLGLDKPFYVQYIEWLIGWPTTKSVIYRTSDGGETWKPVPHDPARRFTDVAFVSSSDGWELQDDGQVFWTKTSGASWIKQLRCLRLHLRVLCAGALAG